MSTTDEHQAASFHALLQTPFVTEATRKAFVERMRIENEPPRFFDKNTFLLLSVVCNCLLGLENSININIAAHIDHRLFMNQTDGWRYYEMPPDGEMFLSGLKGIQETSAIMFNTTFENLSISDQQAVLHKIQQGTAEGITWQHLAASVFFEEVLAETTEIFYSLPFALDEINYVGMADALGWQSITLNGNEEIPVEETKQQ
jgi:gluconate 2-dehydrogenase gamma chain